MSGWGPVAAGNTNARGRFDTVDGLRGYLALAVFAHHAMVWRVYAESGRWIQPSQPWVDHLGKTSVALFFMVTALLFSQKLLDAKQSGIPVDWSRLAVSRILRLWPLYLFAIGVIALTAAQQSMATAGQMDAQGLGALLKWVAFTIPGAPDLFGFSSTWILMAGVHWSLVYEWFFYLLLPFAGALVGSSLRLGGYLAVAALLAVMGHYWRPEVQLLFAFLVGFLAMVVVQLAGFRRFAASSGGSALAAIVLVAVVVFFDNPEHWASMACAGVAFALFAGGADLWGLLRLPTSRFLGSVSFGIYLLHGPALYWAWTAVQQWLPGAVPAVTFGLATGAACFILVPAVWLSHCLIERPCMALVVPACDALKAFNFRLGKSPTKGALDES